MNEIVVIQESLVGINDCDVILLHHTSINRHWDNYIKSVLYLIPHFITYKGMAWELIYLLIYMIKTLPS